MKILCIGDIVGKKGVDKAAEFISDYNADFIIVNIENSNERGGRGFSEYAYEKLTAVGVHVFTGGNHSFDNRNSYFLYQNRNLLRPCNFPAESLGKGHCVLRINEHFPPVLVINVQLRVFMREHLGCPFKAVDSVLALYKGTPHIIVIDMHGEATAEKNTFASFFDGKVSAIFGTHTHIQTADERIMPQGTGYITDVGMVGALHSSLGIKFEGVLSSFLTQIPKKFEIEENGDFVVSGIEFDIDINSKNCVSLKRIFKVV